jgi:hypothetical protein
MISQRFGVAISDLGKSTIMPSVTVRIPMPPGAAIPAQHGAPQAVPSQIPTASEGPK